MHWPNSKHRPSPAAHSSRSPGAGWLVAAAALTVACCATGALAGHGDSPAPAAATQISADWLQQVYQPLHSVGNWLVIGLALFLGRFAGKWGSRVRAPMVVGYLVTGVLLGGSLLNAISAESLELLEPIASFGLGIVAFMIGTELSRKLIRRMGPKLLIIMVSESLLAFLAVFTLVWSLSGWLLPAAGMAMAGALIFGAMAPASAPAGTVAVIQEYKAKGPMTSLLLGVVGLDDGFAILIYAFAAAGAKALLAKGGVTLHSVLLGPCLEIVGAVAVGVVVGVALLLLLRRGDEESDTLIYTMAAILLTTGLANALHLSLILANLTVGTVMANASRRHTELAYDAVKRITGPVYVLFFVVAGAHLDLRLLAGLSLLGPVYIIGRSAGLIGGAYVGGTLSGSDPVTRKYLGLGILSQAGVAIGLALSVSHEFSDPRYGELGSQLADLTINTIAATTIFFEIIGPITTKIALSAAGEIGGDKKMARELT